jgi:DNA-binding NtrC family response regulator
MDPFCKLRKVKTLLVDNDELVRDSMNLVFKLNGCFLQPVETAEEGLKALENEHFDIIISDFELPEMNGLEFLKLMDTAHPNSLKILISACIDDNTELEALANGAHKFIEKPFSVKTLVESLGFLLETAKKKAGS